jgi:methylaspartate mutase epsilon subunit
VSESRDDVPGVVEAASDIARIGKPTAAQVLDRCRERGRVAIQPRCSVADHADMHVLLLRLRDETRANLLTLAVDSYTSLGRFDDAARALQTSPCDLNGYPLVAHGWGRGRELHESVDVPLQVRHGSPDPRRLFRTAIAAGLTSFEGGGVSHNLPYATAVPLPDSLAAWREVDAMCGELAALDVVVEREFVGTLTGLPVPPSISLAIDVLEAAAAALDGVRCLSLAYPQNGNLVQDVAALRAIPELAARYLPPDVCTYAVLHEFVGVDVRERPRAEEHILCGAVTARLGRVAKLVTRPYQKAYGIPDADANVAGLHVADLANSPLLDPLEIDEAAVADEQEWICREVAEIVEPILAAPNLLQAIVAAFAGGRLDVPFSASRYARSAVLPQRDSTGAVRYHSWGDLPLSRSTAARNRRLLDGAPAPTESADDLVRAMQADLSSVPRVPGELTTKT